MSQLPSQEEYERVKKEYQQQARDLEKKLGSDLVDLRNDLVPKYLKGKFLTACAIFGATYMVEELIFRKKVPGLVKFVGALSATVVAPKVYRMVYQNYFEVPPDSVSYPPPSVEVEEVSDGQPDYPPIPESE
ncbi:hypothetical protein [Tunicatimonas pelagia]|uniref:hypothetical protein n=1 Tax=Tunicatimonas pelagia TaxID=931531 RepID=UPI0026664101|nr:hypothetical protein [Tunicatimonas pelagia]WKN43646.1 hypothetical protein P0M28_01515 [Tunicatimonas pelagia]